jgi:hypothetical protein
MTTNKLNVYISTCDSNIFIVKYFQYFFNKYWSKDINVKILGFTPPDFKLESNFEFISMVKEQVGGANGWSNYLIDFFSSIKDEYFVFGLDDFMIARPVDIEVFETCLELLNENVGRIDLQPSLQHARDKNHVKPYVEKNGIKFLSLIDSAPGNVNLYQNAAAFSIWNRKWFLKNIKRNWTPWGWETIGSMSFANGDGYKVIGSVDRWAIKKIECLSNQWPGMINVRAIRQEDIEQMEKLKHENDRIKKFEPLLNDAWFYNVLGGWEIEIFGK